MTKCLLWLLLATFSAAFVLTLELRSAVTQMDARLRENGTPVPYFVHIVEPKMRAEWAQFTNAPATMPATLPASAECSDDG